MRVAAFRYLILFLAAACACGTGCTPKQKTPATRAGAGSDQASKTPPIASYGGTNGTALGEPLGVSVDINGDMFVADGSPARVVRIGAKANRVQEFQRPTGSPGFYPTDVAVQGFFVYTVDETGRTILRFDKEGAYRDVLLKFGEAGGVRRVSPYGMGVDGRGRIAITDVENHQVLLYDSFLVLEVAFGNYGSFAGQLDTPRGVSFGRGGDIIVADTGNRRIQFFSDGGAAQRIVPAPGDDNPFRSPRRAVVDVDGNLYVADPAAGRVFVFDPGGRLAIALVAAGDVGFEPTDVDVAPDKALYVTDAATRKLLVFKVM